ncbi:hypothetical protein [Gottfriedia acidiceleris]|uniref:hypothetical protein n=1 Tax=Gottfriedia acidiceleris TaxID=371036 RepID=UPI003D24A9AA
MRKKINIQTDSEINSVSNIWLQHLVQRIIVDQLDVSHRLQAKLLYLNIVKERKNNETNDSK